ncbi:MAG TPA: UDPGP type 1 family protein [Gemmataceae bacterium]|nr:UDPGP type 1 family protein [Gemmataceae bacterium]
MLRAVPEEIQQRLRQFGQEHVLRWWDRLRDQERQELVDQLARIDLAQLRDLYSRRNASIPLPAPEQIQAIGVTRLDPSDQSTRQRGEDAFRRGEVAALVVAGGQATRLGFDHPKGMFPIGPVSDKTLFQIHAEKVLALSHRYGKGVPLLVLTSPATDAETQAFFEMQRFFGLAREDVRFFCQGTMPALDWATGKLLLEAPGRLFTSPNGHGGTLLALAESGLLEQMEQRGIRQIFYFQVDNPLVKVGAPIFLGHHLQTGAEVSSKIVRKEEPNDRLGNLVLVDGRCTMIEYSDLPAELARQTDDEGRLRISAGSPAIHIFAVDFLRRLTRKGVQIPFHVARKKVPYLDENGKPVQPDKENALKFEMFIFDVLPLAERWAVVETSRREEFVPLKNATGPDSPAVVRQAISNRAADWLEQAGIAVPRQPNGDSAVALEISPLYALNARELAAKVPAGLRVDGPLYLNDPATG